MAPTVTARDTDSNGSANYSPTYDDDGNLTDDKQAYKYTYDAWGRLMTVADQSSTTIAQYTYYGNGWRATFLQDTNADGKIDGSDVSFAFAYDEGWRIVATFRSSDSSPKEQFLNHMAGLGGYGGATGGVGGYIDHVVMRDKDANTAWTTAYDGAREERRYMCPNWRADVSAIVTSAGKLAEVGKNSAYGTAFGLPAGDTDSDGDWDSTDSTNISSSSSYDARQDAELDNDVDANDITYATSIKGAFQTLGYGVLSSTAVGNRKGYGGYEADIYLAKLDHVRNRVLDSVLGRWTRRDPIGYVDGINMLEYAKKNPIRYIDSTGLCCQATRATPPGDAACGPGYIWDPSLLTCVPIDPLRPNPIFERYPTDHCTRLHAGFACFICCEDYASIFNMPLSWVTECQSECVNPTPCTALALLIPNNGIRDCEPSKFDSVDECLACCRANRDDDIAHCRGNAAWQACACNLIIDKEERQECNAEVDRGESQCILAARLFSTNTCEAHCKESVAVAHVVERRHVVSF